ncbi:MAG: alpha/beta hydrolase [Chromatiaceae bacterium]|nr:MAG: alpha/beta hydrolase [Chromatiaceae bacterium]
MSSDRDAAIPDRLRDWLQDLRAFQRKAREQGYRLTATTAREVLDGITRRFLTQIPPVALVRDDLIPGLDYQVPVRVYHPRPEQALPVALFVHGGGHVSGSVSLYDPICRKLALASERIIVSIEYRLAPECPYPAGLKDAMASVKQVYPLLERLALPFTPRVALIGDSGGGALCATVAHLAQYDAGVDIDRQVLIYPSLDYTLSQPSVITNGQGYLLERERILWLFDTYLQNAENRRAVSPLFMEIGARLPPTLIIAAEFDPLRDEAIAYADRLEQHGIEGTRLLVMPGLVHAFLNLEDLVPDACRQVYAVIGGFLQE